MATAPEAVSHKLQAVNAARRALSKEYKSKITANPSLTRSIVSYQANRKRQYYRWFKYKEGFSAALVEYVIEFLGRRAKRVLDPFAGSGATLFASREFNKNVTGIELLPVGEYAIRARLAAERVSVRKFQDAVQRFHHLDWTRTADPSFAFQHLTITEGAFPSQTEKEITAFRMYVRDHITDENIRKLFNFACLCVLESVSYTRKDGQYLRWDHRSPRNLNGKTFDKGKILTLKDALHRQLSIMIEDMSSVDLFSQQSNSPQTNFDIRSGSCLSLLPQLGANEFDLVITSPPYCNRYDYTRTYALELAYLGVDSIELKRLRQALLSCTVENRDKINELKVLYEKMDRKQDFDNAMSAFENQDALQEVLEALEQKRVRGLLNNTNVPRMVRNYFLESAVVIFELARVVSSGGCVVMVNDNVQYAGEEVPVDLILSEFAGCAGFTVEHIWTLERGKGNSSQQMGAHGRNELRKCAYVWRK